MGDEKEHDWFTFSWERSDDGDSEPSEDSDSMPPHSLDEADRP